jgi:CRISPR-associated protein Csx17
VTVHLHHLKGCAPAPLAHYLKAIGVLRLVAQQKDPSVLGCWRGQHFCLLTTLDESALEAFLLEEYSPTPFVSPWNKGSGFFAENDRGLAPVEESKAPRFEAFRHGISAARLELDGIAQADRVVRRLKDQTKAKAGSAPVRSKNDPDYKAELAAAEREFKRLKSDLYVPFALSWRGPHRDWMDAAMVLSPEGEPSWPPLLGTGGNDGRLDFTNTAMQRLGDLFDLESTSGAPQPKARALLRTALFDTTSTALLDAAVGQFLPGSAGGANGTTGPGGGSRINPWDFVLMLEGAVAFRGQATRRLGVREDMRAAIPFAVAAQAGGNATRGEEKDSRGEQWMPLWERPASWNEVRALFGEGRAQIGRSSARRPVDFARAIARLGVARGLTGFVRYGFLERNGQSNLAVPLGRIAVAARPRARLIDEISGWLDRLQREADGAPARFSWAVRLLSDAVFDAVTREAEPTRWQSLLTALDEVERAQVSGTGFRVGPCPALSQGWLEAAADDTPEWRLAISLGSAAGGYRGRGRPFDSVRRHALPLDQKRNWSYAVGADKRLLSDPRVVMRGRDSLSDLIALVERRLVDASQAGSRTLPLVARHGAGASLGDLARFITGEVDVHRTVSLARALMALGWEDVRLTPERTPLHADHPDEAWEALRLCALPFPIKDRTIAAEPAMFRRLAAGDVTGSVEVALRRLRSVGFRPPLVVAIADQAAARRWAGAFAFPISPTVADAMAARFQNPFVQETP